MSVFKSKEVNFDELWPAVLSSARSIINMSQYGHTDKLTWQKRFFDIYNLCGATPDSYAEKLYEETKHFLETHCTSMKKDLLESEQNILNIYTKYWTEFKLGSEHLNSLYTYLNSLLVKNRKISDPETNLFLDCHIEFPDDSPVEIGELALSCWTKIIIEPLKDRLVKLLLEQIHLDRIGECVNQTTIKSVIMSFVDVCQYRNINVLELYEKTFETPFLQATGEYYREEGNRCLGKFDCIQYMKKILTLIDEEAFRSCKFLNPTSYVKVNNECRQRLVCDHFDILKNECNELILKEDYDALKNMYKLLQPTHIGTVYIVEQLLENITIIGDERIQSLKGDNLPTLFVETLLELHTKYINIIRETFGGDPDFISALDKACSMIVNMKNGNKLSAKAAELIAHYCDGLLRKSSKISSETEIEEKLNHGLTIFIYLEDKDYFQRYYQKTLGRRLINQQSTSFDAEEFMLTKLKETCGYEFTSKLARMFQDVKISDDLNIKFLDYFKSESTSNLQNQTMANFVGLDFNINVLQANSWPISPVTNETFLIPQSFEKSQRLFEEFYNKRHNGRKLFWMYNLSNGEIRISHLDRPYVVTMGTYQMAILLLFNLHETLKFYEIEEATRFNMKELEKQILPLIENKFLLKDDTKDLTETSAISINYSFKSKRTRFKLLTVTQKELNKDSEITQQNLDDDRKFYLQAVIVRIMKSRRRLKHNLLIEEVITQSKQRFLPSIQLIKRCIEILIDKQYLERNSTDEYTYNA